MEIQTIDPMAIMRMALILLHVLAVVAAGAGIAFGDYAIFAKHRIDAGLLLNAGRAVSVALLVLWATGLAVIWIDTRFEWAVLGNKPKLLAKLAVVSLLSLNGVALHRIAFKHLCASRSEDGYATRLLTVLGAVSAVTWMYAIFVGLARPVASWLGFTGFIGLYFASLTIGIAAALALVEPRLARRMKYTQHASDLADAATNSEGLPHGRPPLLANS